MLYLEDEKKYCCKKLSHYTYESLLAIKNSTIVELKKRNSVYEEIMSIFNGDNKLEEKFCQLKNDIDILNHNLREIDKAIRKNLHYSSMEFINVDGYDRKTINIVFPKTWNKKKVFTWLNDNNYYTKDRYFSINSDYDCTGKLCEVLVEYKNHIYEATYCYDV